MVCDRITNLLRCERSALCPRLTHKVTTWHTATPERVVPRAGYGAQRVTSMSRARKSHRGSPSDSPSGAARPKTPGASTSSAAAALIEPQVIIYVDGSRESRLIFQALEAA